MTKAWKASQSYLSFMKTITLFVLLPIFALAVYNVFFGEERQDQIAVTEAAEKQ